MQVVYSEAHRAHEPGERYSLGRIVPSPEVAQRADVLHAAALAAGHAFVAPAAYGEAPRAAVHAADFLRFLETSYDRWQALPNAGAKVLPKVFPVRRPGGAPGVPPRSLDGQAGWYMADLSAPVLAGTWRAACAAADSAVHAATLVRDGVPAAYALCRPPGHHAFHDMAGGFCYLNNSAIGAQHLRGAFDRVAIVDVDVHHGNGTQDIFYERDDVLTVSLHGDPYDFYPFHWGHAAERGVGAGEGCNLNVPLPLDSDDTTYLAALDSALEAVREFSPDALVIALGLDAYAHDPHRGLAVTTDGFGEIAGRLARLKLPTVLVQEGGYLPDDPDALGRNLVAFLAGFEGAHG